MIVSLAVALDLAQQCAPSVAPATILAIAHAESSFDTLAINVNNRPQHLKLRPATDPADAARLARRWIAAGIALRSEEHTSELQSLMRISYAVFCLKNKK